MVNKRGFLLIFIGWSLFFGYEYFWGSTNPGELSVGFLGFVGVSWFVYYLQSKSRSFFAALGLGFTAPLWAPLWVIFLLLKLYLKITYYVFWPFLKVVGLEKFFQWMKFDRPFGDSMSKLSKTIDISRENSHAKHVAQMKSGADHSLKTHNKKVGDLKRELRHYEEKYEFESKLSPSGRSISLEVLASVMTKIRRELDHEEGRVAHHQAERDRWDKSS